LNYNIVTDGWGVDLFLRPSTSYDEENNAFLNDA